MAAPPTPLLPEILAPAGTPCFLVASHSATPRSPFADIKYSTGHGRKRRVYTTTPRVVQVAWHLQGDQMAAVDHWFEEVLDVGDRHFSAEVQKQGRGRLFWDAQWVAPYTSEPLALGRYRVNGALLLTGQGSVAGPVITSASVEFRAALDAVIAPSDQARFGAVEFGAFLRQLARSGVEFGVDLETRLPEPEGSEGTELREDGGIELREDGGTELRNG